MQNRSEIAQILKVPIYKVPIYESTTKIWGGVQNARGEEKAPENAPSQKIDWGASFFGIEMSFFWYRGGLSLLFGIEISFLVLGFCIRLFSIYIVLFLGSNCPCFFGPRHPVKWRSKKISIPKRRSKNLDTPKKTSRYQLKEPPEKLRAL